jgi:membrane protein YqaA with SNARE-associated domain
MTFVERFHIWKRAAWERFTELAQGPHGLFWLAACAVADPVFFPIAPEIYVTALMLAHPKRWRTYFLVSITFSVIGASLGYFIGAFLFHQFGMPLLQFYHLGGAFMHAQHLLAGHAFFGMILVAFQLIPEKVFVLAGGFLGLPFVPFILGFAVGRIIRLAATIYLTHRYGMRVLSVIKKYFFWFTILFLAVVAYYVTAHFFPVPPHLWHRPL